MKNLKQNKEKSFKYDLMSKMILIFTLTHMAKGPVSGCNYCNMLSEDISEVENLVWKYTPVVDIMLTWL